MILIYINLAGGIAGGPLIEYIGRRNTILLTAVPFIVSWLLIALATNIGLVLAGKNCLNLASIIY
jgi:facilitated trehalose transporter